MAKTRTRAEVIQEMRKKGMTYEEIGEVFGISKQAVYQAAHPGDGFHAGAVMKVSYTGLRKWMLDNRVTFTMLGELCGRPRLYGSIVGKTEPRKDTIDAILKVTGLTYEECFKEETDDSP